MIGKNRFKRRRAGKGVTVFPDAPESQNAQTGKFFKLCQVFIAALFFFSTAALIAKGCGSETTGPAAAIFRWIGGGVVLLLLHLLYGLFCSLFGRQVSLVKRQWLGTFCMYGAVSLLLGMLRRAGLSGSAGLFSPGYAGALLVSALPRVVSMFLGLALVFLSARFYGRFHSIGASGLKFRLPSLRLPSVFGRRHSSDGSPAVDREVSGGGDSVSASDREGGWKSSILSGLAVAFSELLGRGGERGAGREDDAYETPQDAGSDAQGDDDGEPESGGSPFYGGLNFGDRGEGKPSGAELAGRRSPAGAAGAAMPQSRGGDFARRTPEPVLRPSAPTAGESVPSYARRVEQPAPRPTASTVGESVPSFARRVEQPAPRPSATTAGESVPSFARRVEQPAPRPTASTVGEGVLSYARRVEQPAPRATAPTAGESVPSYARRVDEPAPRPTAPTAGESVPSFARRVEQPAPRPSAPTAGESAPSYARRVEQPAPRPSATTVGESVPSFARRVDEPAPSPSAPAGTKPLFAGSAGDAARSGAGEPRPVPAGAFPPPLDLLGPHSDVREAGVDAQAQSRGLAVIKALANFGVTAELKRAIVGPTVVQYQIQLAPGIKVSKVSALGNDIAVALGVPSIRVEAPIPGTSYIGIELPNANRRAVPLRQVIESEAFRKTNLVLPLPLGQTVDGRVLVAGLEELPHLLIAGTTGSGKSIFVNNCIVAMCWHNTPQQLRFIMVDPKRVEMGIYESLPHILAKPIVTPASAVHALGWAVREMEKRYDACSQAKVRSIASYNEKVAPKDRLPHIVIIVDELADLMMTAQKEVEEYIMRLAQMARAVGIHLMLATQRPSVNVLTGTIKANIPARVSFSLPSVADSRTILDVTGAQNLLGRGDMLFVSTRSPHPVRIQSPFMDEQTNIRAVEYLRGVFGDPEYVDLEEQGGDEGGKSSDFLEDSRLEEAIKIVLGTGVASSSGLQRQMRVGFTRAARMIDTMEAMGIVGPQNGAKPREILVDEGEALEILEQYRS